MTFKYRYSLCIPVDLITESSVSTGVSRKWNSLDFADASIYILFAEGLTPSFFGSLADSIGRRPVYILTLTIYVLACIGLALTPTSAYWLLMVLRCLQATGGSAVIAIGSGCIGDIATPEERGGYIGLFSAVSMGGPAIGPVLGGIMAYSLSWRWIFWLLAIACGINVVVMIL